MRLNIHLQIRLNQSFWYTGSIFGCVTRKLSLHIIGTQRKEELQAQCSDKQNQVMIPFRRQATSMIIYGNSNTVALGAAVNKYPQTGNNGQTNDISQIFMSFNNKPLPYSFEITAFYASNKHCVTRFFLSCLILKGRISIELKLPLFISRTISYLFFDLESRVRILPVCD